MAVTLVTGGAGYIGSHTCVELLGAGLEVVVVDDLSNASHEAVRRIEELGGRPLAGFVEADVRAAPAWNRRNRRRPPLRPGAWSWTSSAPRSPEGRRCGAPWP